MVLGSLSEGVTHGARAGATHPPHTSLPLFFVFDFVGFYFGSVSDLSLSNLHLEFRKGAGTMHISSEAIAALESEQADGPGRPQFTESG